jgi:uncharacterized MAPEG superfamily protein
MLSYELRMLAYSAFLCLILWIPYVLAAMRVRGLSTLAGYPTGTYQDLPDWAQRAQRAHMNLVENLVPFAALVLLAQIIDASNAATTLGAALFYYARLVQAIVHIAGIPYLRTLAFFVSWVGTLIIFWNVVV